MQGLAFVELEQEAAAVLGVGIPSQDMQGSGEAALLLEGPREGVLLGMGLQLLDQQ